jgi:hypothetical protein
MCLFMHVCFDRYEFDRLFYHFARKEQEKKTFGSLGRHLDDKIYTKCNLHQLNSTGTRCTTSRKFSSNFASICFVKAPIANEGKWSSWAPVGERSPSFVSSILRPLMPLGSQTNYINLRVVVRGYAWLHVDIHFTWLHSYTFT